MKKRLIEFGFSLVEMAVVLAIISLLMAGLLPMISGQVDQQHRTETRRQLDEIRAALIGFAIMKGRLPCPDVNNDGSEDFATAQPITNDVPQTGQSTRKTSCQANSGNLPYNQLGVSSTDAFNVNFVYAVTPAFAEKNEIFSAHDAGGTLLYTSYFTLNTAGTLKVCSYTDNAATSPCPNTLSPRLTDNAAAVLLSKGVNGAQTATSQEEIENSDSDSDFVSHENTPTFDDLVVWISPNTLFNRMVSAGKLP